MGWSMFWSNFSKMTNGGFTWLSALRENNACRPPLFVVFYNCFCCILFNMPWTLLSWACRLPSYLFACYSQFYAWKFHCHRFFCQIHFYIRWFSSKFRHTLFGHALHLASMESMYFLYSMWTVCTLLSVWILPLVSHLRQLWALFLNASRVHAL